MAGPVLTFTIEAAGRTSPPTGQRGDRMDEAARLDP